MCDCYSEVCEGGCGRALSLHVADYCTDRSNVHPYCPWCAKKLTKAQLAAAAKVFRDEVDDAGQIWSGPMGEEDDGMGDLPNVISVAPKSAGRKGQKVIILCDDAGAYGIHLN